MAMQIVQYKDRGFVSKLYSQDTRIYILLSGVGLAIENTRKTYEQTLYF